MNKRPSRGTSQVKIYLLKDKFHRKALIIPTSYLQKFCNLVEIVICLQTHLKKNNPKSLVFNLGAQKVCVGT